MGMRINLNTAAMTASRNLSNTSNSLNKSIERLSSGYKINSAGDDPAGLVISEKLRAQVSGLTQAISNSGDAVNMVKTSEGALNEVNSVLRSMRDLAVHAANAGANDDAAKAADQAQISSAISTLNSISSETQFGNKKLLDGSSGLTASIGAGGQVTGVNLVNANITKDTTGITITTTQSADYATLTGTVDVSGDMSANSLTINGVTIQGGANLAATKSNINAVKDQTGVTATDDGSNHLVLTQGTLGSAGTITIANGGSMFGANTTKAGKDVQATVKDGSGFDISSTSWNKGTGNILQDANGNTIQLTDAAATAAAGALATKFDIKAGTLTFQVGAFAGQTRNLNINSTAANNLGTTAVAGKDVSKIDVTTKQGAQDAIKILDAAISQVSTQRASLGAFQRNVLESNINSLSVAKENIAASESSIRDTDMAAEMVEFTKNNILQQAGVSMLSQANQAPQQLLSLLR